MKGTWAEDQNEWSSWTNRGDSVDHSQRTKDQLLLKKNFAWFRVFLGFFQEKWLGSLCFQSWTSWLPWATQEKTYYRMSLQGESQTHYRKKYLHHITVCKLMVQGATHVMGGKKNNIKPRKHWKTLKKNKPEIQSSLHEIKIPPGPKDIKKKSLFWGP